ncbi:MAG: formate--tetrahydrofolate ligase [Candidatus Rokuibacteriota bacterium]|nr:MAG: formate--tetrahydrofolate ligase [Candidatus Rokubacteria bacterium]
MGKQDIDIARAVKLQPIQAIGEALGLNGSDLELYGSYKAKIRWEAIERASARSDGALVLVTAMTPTPAGEGKSTTTIGLADGLRRLGKRAIVAIREPSLGPVFGVKGGGTGGGHTQLAPMEDINLHFTGDMHAIGAAHNLLAAMLDNHLAQGNTLGLDVRRILWKRVIDMNDRALRRLVVGMGGPAHGVPRESGFDITVASEVMAILCLARDLQDFKARVERVVVAEKGEGTLVTARDLRAAGAMAVLMKDAIKPNLVQTLEATPALVHGGPFGNIAHGCNSLIATRLGLKLGEIVVTEAGFASDLGAEKFVDIKCRTGGLVPSAAVIVVTTRALAMHGEENLAKHVENVRLFGIPPVVALNRFTDDTDAAVSAVASSCRALGVPFGVSRGWELGGAGVTDLAGMVLDAIRSSDRSAFRYLYPDELGLAAKLETIAKRVYGADGVAFAPLAATKLSRFESLGHGRLPVCVAKTQNSLSDDPKRPGRPRGFTITVRDAALSAGAGFVVAYAGDILTMPGLPKVPGAEEIDIDERGNVVGLF